MHAEQHTTPHVALLSTSMEHQALIKDLLTENGIEVSLLDNNSSELLDEVHQSQAHVLLVDMAEDSPHSAEIIDTLLEEDSLPIFFNDSSPTGAPTDKEWARQLSRKLAQMAEREAARKLEREHASENQQLDQEATPSCHETDPEPETQSMPEPEADADTRNVWILAASLGGPEAVQEFLAAIDPQLPVAFLLAQHIGASQTRAITQQLESATRLDIILADQAQEIQHQQVIIIPPGRQTKIRENHILELEAAPAGSIYSPSIENILNSVATRYIDTSGVIFFSGMGNDGVKASRKLAEKGLQVWAQSAESCVVSNLPDQARKSGAVALSGTPAELAQLLNNLYNRKDATD